MLRGLGTVLWMLLATVLILLLAGAAARWIGRYGSPYLAAQSGASERLRVLAQLNLGRGERLALVLAGERCLLLGVTEHQITLLRELEDGEAAPWLPAPDDQPQPPDFLQFLHETLRKRK